MRVLIVDNFDSFTHNLAQALGALGAEVVVRRSDAAARDLLALDAERIVLSPGPGGPAEAGCCADLVRAASVPLLGVCLGMQVVATVFGATVGRAPEPLHGRSSMIRHDGAGVFAGLPDPFEAGRYHSLAVDADSLARGLVATAWAGDVLMGLRHQERALEGIQFHPESVLTPLGPHLLANFLRLSAPSPR